MLKTSSKENGNVPEASSRIEAVPFDSKGLHCIRLTALHPRAALMALDRALNAGGADVRRLYMTVVGNRSVADVMLAEVSASAARRIGDVIAASAGVESVSVEHLWNGS